MAANVIRKDVIEIDVDSKSMLTAFDKILKEFSIMKKQLGGTTSDIDDLRKQFTSLGDNDGLKKTKEQTEKVKKSVGDTTDEAGKLKKSFKDVNNTSFNKVTAGLNKIGSIAGKVAKITAKATVAGIGSAATGVATLVGLSVKGYSDYEQLVGGVETLFGAGGRSIEEYAKSTGKSTTAIKKKYDVLMAAQNEVLSNANNAYATAGLSANNYMETVTGFSASLIASLGGDTKKAASYADKAIVDMSDNANKMGTDMASIQNAYQGFAKQNYTMLDNLKLGYGGTQEEMKRLIKDAAKIDKAVKANDMSFGNIVLAIHAVQASLDITGTTAKEASSTIQGSFSSMKSAWGNLITSLVVGGDSFDQCLDNFISSAKTFGENVMPAVEKGLGGVGKLITGLAPYIEAELPTLVDTLLPPLITSATALVKGLIKALPSIIKTLVKELPEVVKQIGAGISEAFGTQMPVLSKFGDAFIQNADVIAKIIPCLLGGVVAFKAIKPIVSGLKNISGTFGKSDKEITKVANPLSNIAKVNVKTVLKGMANIAVIVGGMTVLVAAVMAVSPYIAKLSDFKSFLKVTSAIAVLGIVGATLSVFAGTVGNIPVANVVKGLANMAIMIAGMSAILLAVSVISKFNFDITRMLGISAVMGVLGTIGAVTAVFAGIVGMIPMPVVLLGLANIALVIAGITGIIVAFGELSKIPGFNDFISTGGDVLASIFKQIGKIGGSLVSGFGEGVLSILPAVGDNISLFGQALKPFFESIDGIDLSSAGKFLLNVSAFVASMMAINSRAAKIFTGTVDFKSIGESLSDFATGVIGFFNTISGIPNESYTSAGLLFDSLKHIGNIPNSGGVFQWFSGENDFSGMTKNLPTFGEAMTKFYNNISGISDFGRIDSLFTSLKSASGIESITTLVNQNLDEIVKKVSNLPKRIGDALKSSGESLSKSLVDVWKKAVSASAAPVNKLLDGANWILKEFGSTKQVVKWTPYSKGTDGHRGGNALVNDGRGAELIQMPNGNTFIPRGKNIFIPNAPKGMKVLSAEDTANVMGKRTPTFRYAKGNIDIWDYMDNAGGLVSAVTQKYVNYNGLKGTVLNISKGLVNTAGTAMTSWVKKIFDEFGALSLSNYNPSAGVNQWKSTVIRALKMEGQYSDANVARTLYQMQTESGGNPRAINNWDSNAKRGTPSKGLMQVIDPTFNAYARPGFNKNIYDPLSNILASIRYAVSRYGSLARAYQGHGYANGGIATKPSIFGEAGPEMAIPLTQNKRSRALDLWQKTGSILGAYTPENSSTLKRNNSNITNNYNFELNIKVEGGETNRQTARAVKNATKEALKEFMNDFANNNKPIREY